MHTRPSRRPLRRRAGAVLLLCAALTPALAASARADVFTSDGTSYSGEWSDADTWVNQTTSSPGVPGPSDAAVIVTGHMLSLTADADVGSLEVRKGAGLNLSGFTLASAGDASLLGDYDTPSNFSSTPTSGALEVAGKLTVENTSVTNTAIAIAKVGGSSPGLELSGPLGADPEASSFWMNSTLTQTGGTATLGGHTLTGDLDPVLSGVALTVRGLNDFGSRQLSLNGTGTVNFKPSAITPPVGGKPLLSTGLLTIGGTQSASVEWDEFPEIPDDGDEVDLVGVGSSNANGLSATDSAHAAFTRSMTGALLTASYIGIPKPKATVKPSLSVTSALTGHALPGQTLTCAPGTWSPDGTKAYAWTSDGTPISGAAATTYVATANEAGTDVACEVTVTSAQSSVGKETSNVIHVDAVPINIIEPEATSSGSDPAKAGVGDVLTCDPGMWTSDAPAYAYSWRRDGSPISGQTSATYATVAADNGHEVSCSVVATEGLATSAPVDSLSGVAVASPPTATVKPTAKSTRSAGNRATTGDVLACTPGTWVPDGTKTYAWKRAGSPIGGATTATYTVEPADLGNDVTCSVTVTAFGLSATESSGSVFIAPLPVNTAAPTVSGADGNGKAAIGTTLTCAPGTWSASPSFTYAWTRNGSVAGGRTASTYVVGPDDQDVALRCRVTALADGIDAAATSAAVTGLPADPKVTITDAPSGTIGTRSASVSYGVEPGVTVTGCTLNGAALSDCASPIALSGLATAGSYALVITVANGTGQTGSGTASFETKVAPAIAIVGWPDSVERGQLVHPTFTVDDDATVSCALDGHAFDCTRAGATVPIPASDINSMTHTFSVTATGPGGSATATKSFVAQLGDLPLVPVAISVAAGTKVTAATGDFLNIGPAFFGEDWYSFRGPLTDIASTGDLYLRASWGVAFTAPAKPGTYVEEVWLWSEVKAASMTVNVYAQDAVDTERQLGGVGSKNAPLSCPKGSAGSTYSWYVNDKLQYRGDSNLLPAQSVPKNGTVYCVVNDPKGGSPAPIKVLVDNGTRVAASTAKDGSSVGVTTSAPGTAELSVEALAQAGTSKKAGASAASVSKARKRYKAVATYNQKLKRGKNTIKLKKKLPKTGFRVTLRLKRPKGGYSKPLVLNKG